MPIEPPEVHVTDDPLVVALFVALFAGAIVLALAFSLLRFRREPHATSGDPPSANSGAKSPWSTAVTDPTRPWSAHESNRPSSHT